MNDTTKTKKYKRYDEAFKRQTVEHWLVSGKSARTIAAELGINEQTLKVWKQKFKQLPAPCPQNRGKASHRPYAMTLMLPLSSGATRDAYVPSILLEFCSAQSTSQVT